MENHNKTRAPFLTQSLFGMKRKVLIRKIVICGTTLILLCFILNSCKKEESVQEKTLTIDLNDQVNAALLSPRGYVIIDNSIIVAYTGFYDLPYAAADATCTNCSGKLKYTGISWVVWECAGCGSKFGWDGNVDEGPATQALKVYNVGKAGNILTVHLN